MAGHPLVAQILDEIRSLHSRKNADYTGGEVEKPLGNFERVAHIMALYPGLNWATPFGVAIAYLLKQLDAAVQMYARGHGSQTGEGIPQRLRDVQLYAILAEVLYRDARPAEKTTEIKATEAQRLAIRSIARSRGLSEGAVSEYLRAEFGATWDTLTLDQAAETIKWLQRC